jgi:septation ring formation regulator EzrA
LDNLGKLTLSTATVDDVTSALTAIGNDLKKMKDAEGDLNDERKAQVEAAGQTFARQIQSIAQSLSSSESLSGAKQQVETGLRELQDSFQRALAPIDCS